MPGVSADGTKQWDENGGPNGTGAWVPITNPAAPQPGFQTPTGIAPTPLNAPPRPPVTHQVAGAWGHTGDSTDPATGRPIAGTNGMAVDRDRYRGMGGNPEHPDGPQIDRTVSNESRDLSMGSLGMLRDRAMGGSTPAQEQARQQTAGAVNGIRSGAATIQGGAMARAGAARAGQRIGASVQAQGDQDREALKAREMADAAGQYFGGAQSQRGRDLGLATSQAGLQVGQNAANDQREGFYENLAQDTQNANLNHQLGRNEADVAATQASNNNNAARDAASRAAAKDFTNGILGGIQGTAKGFEYGAEPSGSKGSDDPWDPKNYTGSDERMKRDVMPLYAPDGTELHMSAKGKGYLATSTPDVTSGASLSGPVPRYGASHAVGAKTAPKPAPKAAPADLKKQGEAMLATQRAATDASLAEGPSVRRVADGTAENGYETTLTDGAEKAFTANRGRYYGADTGSDYDLRGAFAAGETRGSNGHMTDRFKKPNHETFSDESQYDKGDGKAGHWVGERFTPGERQGFEDSDVEAIRYGVKKPAPANVYGDIRDEDPAVVRARALREAAEDIVRDNRGVGGAQRGYALSRAGQPGDMFYGGPRKGEHEDPDMAPGTHDFRKHGSPVDRDVMTSDANAKRAAFIEGVNHTQQMHDTGIVAPPPAYMAGDEKPGSQVHSQPKHENSYPAATRKFDKADAEPQRAVNRESEKVQRNIDEAYSLPVGAGGVLGAGLAAKKEGEYQASRSTSGNKPEDAPPPVEGPGVFSRLNGYATQARAMMPSDERAKAGAHPESPMADANRSMAPSVYEYKPGFAEEAGQREGEKNVGPMAQHMEADPIAATAIVKRPDGMLAIDKDKGLKLVMGGLADLQGQLDSLQRKKERRA